MTAEPHLLSSQDRRGARAVAELHRRCFPDYDSSRLGTAFCARLLRSYAANPESWVAVLHDGGAPAGYLVAAPPPVQRSVNRALRPWGALASLRSPGRAVRRLAGRTRPRSAPPQAPPAGEEQARPDTTPATVRVVLIGTDPASRGRGFGGLLLDDFARRAGASGHLVADLSVAIDNAAAREAYERAGWKWVGDEGGTASRYRLRVGCTGS
ncbi:MAG: GNAT family N-acetyltransferase [Acidimicrobiales bacterium]|nr:GNAT family N-acetyltransferase [Acidimicrobiales bacterium]